MDKGILALCRLPGFYIQINICNNILFTGGVKCLKAGINIFPHTVFGKKCRNLLAG